MKRWGILLLILTLCCAPGNSLAATKKALEAAPLVEDTTATAGTIRVWLSTLSGNSYTVTVAGDYTVNGDVTRPLPYGEKVTVEFSGGKVYLTTGGTRQEMGSDFTLKRHAGGSGYNALKIAQGLVPGAYYPGDLQFVVSGGKNYVIAHLYIEEYVYGVLPYEMDNGWPLEALKAQAVAARTYAIRAAGSGLYEVSDTTQHQVFRGVNYEKTNCIRAVDETWGVVMKYEDKFVSAYYSASNGGQTESNSNFWGGTQMPYLQVKDDPFDLENPNSTVKSYLIYSKPAYGTSNSAYEMIAAAISSQTGKAVSAASIEQINSVSFDTPRYAQPSRLYTQMKVKATYGGGKTATVSLSVFDTVKGALSLKINSSDNELFSVEKEEKGFRVYARRWGHGIGMSQRGAAQMANLGYSYAQILGFYYTGSTRVRMNFTRSLLGSISGKAVESVPTPAPVEDAVGVISRVTAVVSLDSEVLNLREKASAKSDVLATIRNGEEVVVLSQGEWSKVEYDGQTGYVMDKYLVYEEMEGEDAEDTAYATEAVVTLSSGELNVRAQADAESELLGTVKNGAAVYVLSLDGEWARIFCDNLTGYVLGKYLMMAKPVALATPVPTAAPSAKAGDAAWVICEEDGRVNLRKKASTSATILERLPYGTEVLVTEKSGEWCKVTHGSTIGYVSAEFLTSSDPSAVSSVPLDEDVIYGKAVWIVSESGEPVNLRKGASGDADVLLKVKSGSDATLINTVSKDWYKVICQGLTGFVDSDFIAFANPAGGGDAVTTQEDTSAYTTVINTGRADMNSRSATLHLRAAMDDLADITGTLKQGESIEVLHYGQGGKWLYVRAGSLKGYMYTEFAALKYDVACVTLEDADSQLVVRKSASKKAEPLTRLSNGTAVTVLSQSGGWSKIRTEDGAEGYASSDYLKAR